MSQVKEVIVQGLWKNNSALVQLLGLCPLLAVTSTATNALGLGLATTLVLTLTNFSISVLRRWTPSEIRIPIYVMIIASVVSVVQMLINAYAFGLYQSLGIFIPLIVTNCIVVGRAEAFAVKNNPAISALDGFSIGMGATAAMFVLGSLREILGNGTLFDGADALLGGWAKSLRIEVFHTDTPFLLAMLPPGAFIGLGMMLALKYLIDEKRKRRAAERSVQAMAVDALLAASNSGAVSLDTVQQILGFTPQTDAPVDTSPVTDTPAISSSSATNSTTSSGSVSSPENLEEYFKEASETYGVDINLLKAIARQESNFNPSATSSAGAMGVMQLMPSTAKGLGVTNAYDAQENIMGGAKLMAQNLKKYNGDVSLALAAYNAGGGNVDKYGGIPPFKETQNYVKKVLGYYQNSNA